MPFFKGRQTPSSDPRLVGEWRADPADAQARAEDGDATITFSTDGSLVYKIDSEASDSIIQMTWRVEDGSLITDQPSEPREERSAYNVTDDVLTLNFGGIESRWLKAA